MVDEQYSTQESSSSCCLPPRCYQKRNDEMMLSASPLSAEPEGFCSVGKPLMCRGSLVGHWANAHDWVLQTYKTSSRNSTNNSVWVCAKIR